jgi:hypothetical protein
MLSVGPLSIMEIPGKSMIRIVFIVIALSVSAPAVAQLPSPTPEIAAEVTRVDRYPAHNVTFPNGVRGIPDVVYWNPVGHWPLTLDLYLRSGSVERSATGFPLVVYVHGGSWLIGDTHRSGPFVDFPGVLAALSAKGYVVASIEYRLSNEFMSDRSWRVVGELRPGYCVAARKWKSSIAWKRVRSMSSVASLAGLPEAISPKCSPLG